MNNNKLIIAAAGSGKTTFIVNEALSKNTSEKILITTYTEANEVEIKKKILEHKSYIPSNITIQTWFSFLLQHGVKPYQGSLNDILFEQDIEGMILVNEASGIQYTIRKRGKTIKIPFKENAFFTKHYFSKNWKIYSDKLSKFVIKCNDATDDKVIERISKIYSHIFIDEIQDLAGYDLEIIKLLFKSESSVLLVGDPRQVTYLTHHESKYNQYKNGKIKDFVSNELTTRVTCDVDEETLIVSHRNNQIICDFSAQLYPDFSQIESCTCDSCRNYITEHEGIFLVKKNDLNEYIERYKPVQLRWNKKVEVKDSGLIYNFGESKGLTFDRVLIYPTKKMRDWINNNNFVLNNEAKAKFYVAITRARFSVAIVFDYDDEKVYNGLEKFIP